MTYVGPMLRGVLLDTSFLLRFLNEFDPLFKNADGYFQYLTGKKLPMYLSTVAVAEYCVGGSIDQLPMRYMRIVPFNVDHAIKAGFFRALLRGQKFDVGERLIISNDLKLFAQADVITDVSHFLTADDECKRRYNRLIEAGSKPSFEILSISTPLNEVLGQLDF
jgi:hypothetical protein